MLPLPPKKCGQIVLREQSEFRDDCSLTSSNQSIRSRSKFMSNKQVGRFTNPRVDSLVFPALALPQSTQEIRFPSLLHSISAEFRPLTPSLQKPLGGRFPHLWLDVHHLFSSKRRVDSSILGSAFIPLLTLLWKINKHTSDAAKLL